MADLRHLSDEKATDQTAAAANGDPVPRLAAGQTGLSGGGGAGWTPRSHGVDHLHAEAHSEENTAECERFIKRALSRPDYPGRFYELCTGENHGGAPFSRESANRWRAGKGLPELPPRATKITVRFGPQDGRPIVEPPTEPQKPLSFLERALSAAKAVANVATNGFTPLSDEQIQARLAICQACDQFDAVKSKCKLCGCGCNAQAKLLNKLAHPDQECPHSPPKWGAVRQIMSQPPLG